MSNPDERIHLWEISASAPETNHSYANLRIAVVCRTMERAIALFKIQYPDSSLHSVIRRNYVGTKSVLVDPEDVKNVQHPVLHSIQD